MASAAATARSTVAASNDEPVRIVPGSLGEQRRVADVGQPDRHLRDPPALHGEHHAGSRRGVVADLALQFLVGPTVTGGRQRDANAGDDLAGAQRREIGALVERTRRDLARTRIASDEVAGAQALHQRRHVVAWVAVGHVAADRAARPHLRVGNHQRGLADDRDGSGEVIGRDQVGHRRGRANHDGVALAPYAAQFGDAGEIDQRLWHGEAQLHHRDQAVATGQRPRVFAQICQ